MKPIIPLALTALLLSGSTLMAGGMSGCTMQQPQMQQKCGMRSNQPGMNGSKMHQKPLLQALQKLDLSDDQLDKFEALQKSFQEQRMAQRSTNRLSSGALADAISEKGFDVKAFEAAEKERSEARAAMKATHLEQIIEILTPAQRIELKKSLQGMKAMRQKRQLNLDY